MRSTALTFKTKAGIFVQDRFTPLLQGIINLVLSYIFVQYWGLTGVLFATSISILSIGFWQFPKLCYKYVFHQSLWKYFRSYFLYSAVASLALIASIYLCDFFSVRDFFVKACVNGLISILTLLPIYIICFRNTQQYMYLQSYVHQLIALRKK